MPRLQLHSVGHRLQGAATIVVSDITLSAVEATIRDAEHRLALAQALPKLDVLVIKPITLPADEYQADVELPTHHEAHR